LWSVPGCCSAEYESQLGEAEVKSAFKVIDTNGDGEIELREFAVWWAKERK
jgi:Ca2+-binding EF-hand superfamily protein